MAISIDATQPRGETLTYIVTVYTLPHAHRYLLDPPASPCWRHGSVSRREVAEAKIHTQTLSRLVRADTLERVARGRYRLPNAPVTEHHGLTGCRSGAEGSDLPAVRTEISSDRHSTSA